MRIAVLIAVLASLLGGCTLIAAGVIGAEVERQHQDWCRSIHSYDASCWRQ